MLLARKVLAEFIGTFWLTFGGCGSAVFAAVVGARLSADYGTTGFNLGIGLVGVSFAFGLTVLTMAYAIGHISGCHLNPAVSVGLMVARRFSPAELVPYVLAQVGGAVVAAGLLFFLLSHQAGATPETIISGVGALATNGFGAAGASPARGGFSPGGFSMVACFVGEVVLTFMFLMIILGATDKRAPAGFAPIAIGLGLTLIHLIGIPLTNLSVNPARSIGPAVVVAGDALQQLWLFIAAPIAGAALAGIVYPFVAGGDDSEA